MSSNKLQTFFFSINFLFSNSFSEKNRFFFLNLFSYFFFYSSLCALRKRRTTTIVQFKEAAECQQERKGFWELEQAHDQPDGHRGRQQATMNAQLWMVM